MLRNAAYQNPSFFGGRNVRLTGGQYEETPRPLLTERVVFETAAFGDLQGDGVEEAVVDLRYWGSGAGDFAELIVVCNDQGQPRQTAMAAQYDRESVLCLSIAGGVITAEVLVHGPGEGLCCPGALATRRYRLDGDRLIRIP